jgi:hypothetical protein
MHTPQLLYLFMQVILDSESFICIDSSNDIVQGLGQTNLTWKMVITEALAPELPNVQWILPHAYVASYAMEYV